MAIESRGIDDHRLARLLADSHALMPKVSMEKARLEDPLVFLEWFEKTGDDLLR